MVRVAVDEVVAGIDLTDSSIGLLAATVIEREGRGDTPFGMYCFASGQPEAELARAVERRVFEMAFGNSPALMEEEYLPYERSSVFTCVLDHRRTMPIAACRMLMPGGLGWKTLDDLGRVWQVPGPIALRRAGLDPDPARLWDCATLAVEPSYRKSFIVQAIMGSVSVMAAAADTEILVSTIDCRALRVIQRVCGRPWNVFADTEPRSYLDSPMSVPTWTNIPAFRDRLRRDRDPALGPMFDPTFFAPAISAVTPESMQAAIEHLVPSVNHVLSAS